MSVETLKKVADALGVDYDGRAGEKKMTELLTAYLEDKTDDELSECQKTVDDAGIICDLYRKTALFEHFA